MNIRSAFPCAAPLKWASWLACGLIGSSALAVQPVVKTVPWVASNPLIPHDTWVGKTVTLKGTCAQQGANFSWTWDFGDGSPTVSGTLATAGSQYGIEAKHAYGGPVGQIYTANLTVTDTSTAESTTKQYYVKVETQALPVEVNVAIDEGLWAIHKGQTRSTSGGIDYGNWASWHSYPSITSANVLAFEVNGHLETGSADNPYTETVQRGLRQVFAYLLTRNPPVQTLGDPDANNNDLAIYCCSAGADYPYQTGIVMDAIIASGTPNAVTTTGVAGVVGREYDEIIQDMVDFYSEAQYDSALYGGWQYGISSGVDNSASQWAAIGIIPAERFWGATVPVWMKNANIAWLNYSQQANGIFGYTSSSPIFGPYGTTPSGMVQLAMHGFGRGDSRWDRAETIMRDGFKEPTGNYTTSPKNFLYGLFAFVKSMLLHDQSPANNVAGDGVADPISLLKSSTVGVNPIDWYSAEKVAGPAGVNNTDGVARWLVNRQVLTVGANYGRWVYTGSDSSWTSEDGPYFTSWAIVMLQRTLFASGLPVAVAKATPNPAVAFQTINLSGADSFHQDGSKVIVLYQWDLDFDGQYDDATGPFTTVSYPAVGTYFVGLKVTDNSSPVETATTTLAINVNTPPLAPTANAGSLYNFCLGSEPFFLNGTGSSNPDQGQSEPGQPADTIIAYEWDLDGDSQYDDAVGSQPNVTASFTTVGSFVIGLKVTDNTAAAYPSSGQPNLSDVDNAVVHVKSATDPDCACVTDASARAKVISGKPAVQVTWTQVAGADHYNVYRGTVAGGPYLKIGSTSSSYSVYTDGYPTPSGLVLNTTYYYVVRPADALDREECQSNEASARPRAR